jgi:hypothetical protein
VDVWGYTVSTVPRSINQLLEQLAELQQTFGPRDAKKIETTLRRLSRQRIDEPEALIRFHEVLLFLRAYPQTSQIVHAAEFELRNFSRRVALLQSQGVDLSALDDPEMSGIAGTSVTDTFSYSIVRWLLRRHPTQIAFYWDWFEDQYRLAETWPRFMPLLEDDSFVEANVPYVEWLRAARNGRTQVGWLVNRFEQLALSEVEKAELYNSQKLYVRWSPTYKSTRTGMRLPARKIFYHQSPLIQRREISFREELEKSPSSFQKLTAKEGESAVHMTREASTVRYRELYGFTHGDPRFVLKVDVGRGVVLFIMGVPPERRLPLRAYHAAMIYKNGVPVGYFEGLSLFERMESGFNFYYTFRDGETAWIYARTLNVFRHLLGVTAFSIDPYQVGYENEEGVESGAFWFYRKLGFRPTRPSVLKLTEGEERKIASHKSYRTSKRTLRRLAGGSMIFQLNEAETGDWDSFQARNIGLAVQRRMATRFGGDALKMRMTASNLVASALCVSTASWNKTQLGVFSDFSVVLSLIPGLDGWKNAEKEHLFRIIQAKASAEESRYLKLMQRHERLRSAIIRLGSNH